MKPVVLAIITLVATASFAQEPCPVKIGDGADTVLLKTGYALVHGIDGDAYLACFELGLSIRFDSNNKVYELGFGGFKDSQKLQFNGISAGMKLKDAEAILGKPAVKVKDGSHSKKGRTKAYAYLKDGYIYLVTYYDADDKDRKKDCVATFLVRKANL